MLIETGRKRRRDPGSVWAVRESDYNARGREARRAEIYSYLRAEIPDTDKVLIGWPVICEWLAAHGFTTKTNSTITPLWVRNWARRLKMPYTKGRPGVTGLYTASLPMTTEHALLAWALSLYRMGGPSLPRIRLPDERR